MHTQAQKKSMHTGSTADRARLGRGFMLMAPMVLLVAAGQAMGQTRTWRNAANGTFSTGSNWVGSVAPGAGNAAVFGLNANVNPFTVAFTANATTAGLTVSNQRPIFNLAGFTYNITGDTTISGTNAPALTITNGTFNARAGGGFAYVGRNAGQTGTVTLGTGASSNGINFVGYSGTGTLNVISGATVTHRIGEGLHIGELAGSVGQVTVSGPTTRLNVAANIYPGRNGAGALRVDGGAVVVTDRLSIANGNGSGTVTVSGTNSRLESTGSDGRNGTDGSGQGTLIVENGGYFSHGVFMHGGSGGTARGDFVVRGSGSTMISPFLHLGDWGTGTLRVESGGVVTCEAGIDVARGGPTATAMLTVTGSGSVVNAGYVQTTGGGLGEILVENGGRINVAGEANAAWPGTRQSWIVRGNDSLAQFGNVFRVSDAQSTSIRIESGANWLSTDRLELANASTTHVDLVISGTGSAMTLAGELATNSGPASIEVSGGGVLTARNGARIGGGYTDTPKNLLVRGGGSRLVAGDYPNTNGNFFLGYESTSASATIDQGGTLVVNNNSYVGHRGTGAIIVSDEGSLFETPHRLHVGWDSPGSNGVFTLAEGGDAALGSLWMRGGNGGGTAIVNLTHGDSLMLVQQGVEVYEGAILTVADGSGLETAGGMGVVGSTARPAEINLRNGGYAYVTGRIDLGSNLPDTGVGILTLDGGTAFTLDYMPILDNGIFRGTGTFAGSIGVNGLVQPGLPIGTLNVTSIGFNGERQPRLDIQIGGTTADTEYDRLSVTNNATLHGTLSLSLANGFVPVPGQTFDVITAGSINGQFSTITGTDLGAGKAFVAQYLPNALRLIVDGVTGVDIAQATMSVVEGYQEPLTVSATYAVSAAQNVTSAVTWTSDDPGIAAISADGKVTGVSGGTTTVRARYAGFEDTVAISVRDLPKLEGSTPGLIGTIRDQGLLEFDLLTPFMTTSKSSIQFDGGEANTLSGRTTWYGARFTGRLNIPTTGTYTFVGGADDVVSVWIDGKPVTFGRVYWNEQPGSVELTAGEHDIRVDYAQSGDAGSWMGVDWWGPGITRQRITSAFLVGGQATLEFFDAPHYPFGDVVPELDQFRVVELDTYAALNRPLYPNGYTGFRMLRYEADIAIPDAGEYTFTVNVDDGANVWLNGVEVLTAWSPWAFGFNHTFTQSLERGVIPIRVDYTEHQGHYAGLIMSIEGPGISKQVIPAAAFTHGGTPAPACIGDFNQDGGVDGSDVDFFFVEWEAGNPTADVNQDGGVDGADVGLFFERWEQGC